MRPTRVKVFNPQEDSKSYAYLGLGVGLGIKLGQTDL